MKINGKVATIIFKSDKTSWTVLLLKTGEEYVTAVGDTYDIEIDEELELDGEEVTHKVYGKQFKFSTYRKILPKSDIALIAYIADNIKGVGKKTASNIVNSFKDETVEVIRFSPEKLKGIKGLNDTKISDLNLFFNEEWEKWNTIEYLSNFNISVVVASKIYEILGKETIEIVNENPYSLIGFVKTLDFEVVDQIGQKMGISLDNEDRIDMGIIYILKKFTEFGHTCIDYETLVNKAIDILKVQNDNIDSSIVRLKMSEKIYEEIIDNKKYLFDKAYYIAEQNIAQNIVSHACKPDEKVDYIPIIDNKKSDIKLSDEQKKAINTSLNSSISVITGGPGTGKTTIIKSIIDILESIDKEYILCAPTGRAAKRITQTTKKEAKTLHRLLEISKIDDTNLDYILNYQIKPIIADVVIVDEVSMIDTLMMNNLLKAISIDTKIILVGDVNQLPSVGPGNVLKDIIDSGIINTIYLKTIYRQSVKSDIVLGAHKVNSGEHINFSNKDTDLFFIKTDSIDSTIAEISSLISYRLETSYDIDVNKDLQVLTPMRKTELGTINLNVKIQEILNPRNYKKNEKEFTSKVFREGDKVMQIVNNYDKKFAINGEFFDGIYNGDIGYISSINNDLKKMYITFDEERLVEYDFDEMDQIEHAYATTIHKAQGSEFDYVILPLYIGYPKLFTRNLLYTAMTRAKKLLIIVGSRKIIDFMVDNIETKNRNTGLRQKILSLKENN